MFRVFCNLSDVGAEHRAVAVGNFDGVHAGHRQLLRRVVDIARDKNWRPSILTFDPHPTVVVAPDRAPKLLSTIEARLHMVRQEGIEHAIVLPFDSRFASLTPEQFTSEVLVKGIGAKGVFVGENFRFGARQAGDVELLTRLGQQHGFCVGIVPDVYVRGRMVSSSEVRRLLTEGNVSLACRLLERPYAVVGSIVSGHGIGSKQTVPTLNLQTNAEVIPADGVYITRTTDMEAGRYWPSITNIGMRPTFDGDRRTIETFLLSPLEGATPKAIRLEFLKRLREERKFDSPEALKAQILRDVEKAQTYFRRLGKVTRAGRERPTGASAADEGVRPTKQ
jgi:riboflavin kinase / FMN adenylyltransferase